jgi:hypothetical protein
MADQPIPDFSQNQQYAPGFQPQMPIPGISSSYPQFQQQQSPFNNSQMIAQQADMLAVQSMSNARSTMALTQQNLMYSMHNAMLGTMNAFTDITRRGGAMINSVSAAGRYNDMLAPNQNWALESSFRREIGFHMMRGMDIDPYNSTFSRIIQGRRPEFLTEGEYSSTMGYAGQLRTLQFEKGLASVGASTAMGWGVSALGLGLAPALAIPMAGGLVIDRMLEAQHAEKEDLLRQQMYVKNKRVGIGQQYISTNDMARVHNNLYEQSNPYWSRFFGDNALGNAFKPDVDKMKIFSQANEAGLFSNENLDADSIIKKIGQITNAVEKFSRIGKVTREASIQMMSELKGAGIHGDDLINDYKSTAITSSLTGIDMQRLIGIKAQAARTGSYLGYDTYSASSNAENTLSGFAMMQANGLFKQKDIMQMTRVVTEKNMEGGTQDILDINLRYKGDMNRATAELTRQGGGDIAVGLFNEKIVERPVLNKVQEAVDQAMKRNPGGSFKDILKDSAVVEATGGEKGPAVLAQVAWAHFNKFDELSKEAQIRKWLPRIPGKEIEPYLSITQMGTTNSRDAAMTFFNSKVLDSYLSASEEYMKSTLGHDSNKSIYQSGALGETGKKFKELFKDRQFNSMEDLNQLGSDMQSLLKVDEEGNFTDSEIQKQVEDLYGKGDLFSDGGKIDSRWVGLDLLKLNNPEQFAQALALMKKSGGLSEILSNMRNVKDAKNTVDVKEIISKIQEKSGGLKSFRSIIQQAWEEPGSKKSTTAYLGHITRLMKEAKDDNGKLIFSGGDIKRLQAHSLAPFADSREARLHSVLKELEIDEYSTGLENRERERKLAANAGLSPEDYRKAYQRYLPFAKTYLTDNGDIKSEELKDDPSGHGKTNLVKDSVREEFIKTLEKMTDKDKTYFASKHLPYKNVDELVDKLKDTSNLWTQESLSQVTRALTGADHILTDQEREEATAAMKSEEDPAGSAIDTLNKILQDIYKIMNKDKSPVPD